jgi:HlyD family secretion protein
MKAKVDEARDGVESAAAAVAQAEALEETGRVAVKYQIALEESGGLRTERDRAEAELRAAKAGVGAARKRLQAAQTHLREAERVLDQTAIKIPMSLCKSLPTGSQKRFYHVLERKVQLGQFVSPQTGPLFTLAGDLKLMEVHADVAEGDVGRVRKGQAAVFTVSAYWEPDIRFRGVVKDIRPVPINVKGAVFYDTVIEALNERDPDTNEWRLRPGMTAAVDVIRREHRQCWKVPTAALNFQLDPAYQSDAAKARLAEWQGRKDAAHWKPIWVWDEQRAAPWPIFVRIGGLRDGEPGIRDGEFNEVLEWEPGRAPAGPREAPRVITDAPPATAPGILDQPSKLKVS